MHITGWLSRKQGNAKLLSCVARVMDADSRTVHVMLRLARVMGAGVVCNGGARTDL